MKGSGTTIMVRKMFEEQGKSISEIARELNMSRNTIRKYLREDPKPDKRIGTKRASKLDPYKERIHELMNQGIYNATVIYDRILAEGYTGKLSILKAYISPLRPPIAVKGEVKRRYESKPGSQVQMDWGICKYLDYRGRERRVACFVMILGYSRMRYVEFSKRCDSASLLRCIVNAFEYYGGIPERLLTDHMKTVVNYVERGETVWQKDFEHFAADLGFLPKLCRVRRPQTKGKVERLVHYVKDNFLPGRKFIDLVDLNNQAQHWMKQVNGREHGTTGEPPIVLLAQEKLKPLPSDGRHLAYRWEPRKVSMESFVSFDGFKYGVHYSFVDKMVEVTRDWNRILIRYGDKIIQEHPERRTGGKYVYAKDQYKGLTITGPYVGKPKYAQQIQRFEVETRELNEYERVVGGVGW